MFSSSYFVTGVKVRKITSGELGFCPLGFSWGDVAQEGHGRSPCEGRTEVLAGLRHSE